MQEVYNLIVVRWSFFQNLLLEHINLSLFAISLSLIIGFLIGVCISEYQKSSKLVLNVINIAYTIPAISLLGFLIPFSGIGNTTAVIALVVYGLLPIVRTTYVGLVNIDAQVIEAAYAMGSTRWQVMYRIKLPLAMPQIIAGLKNMVVTIVAFAGIASFIGAGGLGVAIYRGITTNNTAMIIAGSLIIAILAVVFDFYVGIIDKLTDYHYRKKKVQWCLLVMMTTAILAVPVSSINFQSAKIFRIATKAITEQYIIGEMLKVLIEEQTDITVELTHGVGGGTTNIHPAMVKGEFDMYLEYTGTGWNTVLKEESIYQETKFNELQQKYYDKFQFVWVAPYGFNNTYGLAVQKDIAQKYQMKTFSDLAVHAPSLTIGAEYGFFELQDGYPLLQKNYHMNFKSTLNVDLGLKYETMRQHKVDVINIFTTDAQLHDPTIIVLEDDLHIYPSYLASNVLRQAAITKYPEVVDILRQLENKLDDTTMMRLNYDVDVKHQEPTDVAYQFLAEQQLVRGVA